MRIHTVRRRTQHLLRLGLVTGLTLGLAACVPGSIRIGTNGVSFGFSSALLGFGGSSSTHNGQYALPTATTGPRGVAATFENEVACNERIGNRYGQGFLDVASGECYACPEGYERNALSVPVTEPEACRLIGSPGIFQTAEFLGPQGCDGDSFEINGACYSCPVDMEPTGSGDVGTACLALN